MFLLEVKFLQAVHVTFASQGVSDERLMSNIQDSDMQKKVISISQLFVCSCISYY
jgi:hypothetical protein